MEKGSSSRAPNQRTQSSMLHKGLRAGFVCITVWTLSDHFFTATNQRSSLELATGVVVGADVVDADGDADVTDKL